MLIQITMFLVHIINLITIIYMIFKENRSANIIIAWILILYLTPLIGFILFLLLGRKIDNKYMYKVKEMDINVFDDFINESRVLFDQKYNMSNLNHFDMIRTLLFMDYAPYRENNDVDIYVDGKDFFNNLINDLEKAKKIINIQFYIFKNDEIGSKILDILKRKAEEGLEIRLLYDSVGSRSLNKKNLNELVKKGGRVGEFFPAWLKIINFNMNFRNHRKIVVIDNEIGYIGGFNVGDEYLGKSKKFGYWRDTHIRFKGPAIIDLNMRFWADWVYTTKEKIDSLEIFKHKFLNDVEHTKNIGMQILSSGPNVSDRYEIKLAYLKMIQKAERYIYIQSPYLIIDKSISDALKLAALSGVDVKIMIPGKGDHPFVYWANYYYAGELINFGVKIYHYDKNSFLHSKTIVIDDEVSSVGTANMDTRSFELNFEINSFIYSVDKSIELRKAFEEDLLNCNELTTEIYKNRSRLIKIKESISKLFSAIL